MQYLKLFINKMRFLILVLVSIIIFSNYSASHAQSSMYYCDDGKAIFSSDAPLEIIEGSSNTLKGVISSATRQLAFTIDIISFTGLNSALQLEHFRENYMEVSSFPVATFEGKIIEQIDVNVPGSYKVRTKGSIRIHGIAKEIIVPCQLISDGKSIQASAEFDVMLDEFNIAIPKVVNRKISEIISVRINAVLLKK